MTPSKITRKFTPGPWHDQISHDYNILRDSPSLLVTYMRDKWSLDVFDARVVWNWTRGKFRSFPCPVL